MKGHIGVEVSVDIDIEGFASALSSASSDDQAAFFEEFFVAVAVNCHDVPNGLHHQLAGIIKDMGLHAREILEQMAEISKEAA